jgi:23S rRNA pseudouridine1911/1915/1917 synthase
VTKISASKWPAIKNMICFEDTHLLVLSKPAGLLSQGDASNDENLVDLLRIYLGRPYVGLVHRLDRNTSGLMVVAKRSKSADRLTQSLKKGELVREYRAWLRGELSEAQEWRHWLLKDEQKNEVSVVNPHRAGAKEASLKVSRVGHGEMQGLPLTLAEFELDTGRSHQIRVQAAAQGYPLLGDPKYGRNEAADRAMGRPALHSFRLRFPHPMSKQVMSFEDPLPADMARLWKGDS